MVEQPKFFWGPLCFQGFLSVFQGGNGCSRGGDPASFRLNPSAGTLWADAYWPRERSKTIRELALLDRHFFGAKLG